MKINSHGWLKTALHRLPCIYIILWKYLNKHPTGAAALIQGRRLLTFPLHVRRLIEGGACSSKHGIYQHVRNVTFRNESNTVSLTIYLYTKQTQRRYRESGRSDKLLNSHYLSPHISCKYVERILHFIIKSR